MRDPDDHRLHWRLLIGASLTVLAAAFIAPRFTPKPDLQENRALAEKPAWPKGLAALSGYRDGLDAYVADNFPARPYLIGGLNFLRMRAGVSGSPNVTVGRDGWLFFDDGDHMATARGDPPFSDDQARGWLNGLAGRTEALQARGVAYLVISPPDKEAVYPDKAPWWFKLDPNRPAPLLARLAASAKAGEVLYLGPAIQRQAGWGLKTYSALDTHWTGLGAYVGYVATLQRLKAMGAVADDPRPLDSFDEVRAEELNKPRNLALMLGVSSFLPADYPEIEDPDVANRLAIHYLTDKLDWTQPRVIDTGQVGKPTLLITMDSFSNAFLPFLYSHFGRIVVAHNQDGAWRQDLIDAYNPNVVITEVVEANIAGRMDPSPAPSEAARQRIAQALAAPHRLSAKSLKAKGKVKLVEGGPGPDLLEGSDRNERMFGRPGNDTVHGGRGDDIIRGGQGNDEVFGDDGDDWVSGDRGDDTLTGGRGADIFHGFAGADLDVVTDFNLADGDRIELDAGSTYTLRQEGADTVIEMTGSKMVLKNIRADQLPAYAIRYRLAP